MDVYDFRMGYRGLIVNGHRTAAGLATGITGTPFASEDDTIRVDRFDPSRLQQRDQREALHLLSGGDLGDATLTFRYLSLSGALKAVHGGALADRIATLLRAFDIEEAQAESPATEGLMPFTFVDVTQISTGRGTAISDTHGNAYEYVAEQYLARPASYPIITGRRSGGDSVGFAVELVCADRRRYLQTPESVVANGGNGFSATCPNWSATTGIAVPPVLTIVTSGVAANNVTITLNGLALVLNLAEAAGTYTVDCKTGLIKKGSTHRADLRTSGVTTPFMTVPGGGAPIVVTNTANLTSVTAAYSQARG